MDRLVAWFACAGLALVGAVGSACAQTWIGNGSSGSIYDSGNWSGGTAPAGTSGAEDLVFGDVIGSQTTVLFPTSVFHNITFTSTTRPAYTFDALAGPAAPVIGLNGGIIIDTNGADVTFASTVDLSLSAGQHPFDINGLVAEGLIVHGDIGGSGGLLKTGGALLTLYGTNNYSGGTTVRSGELDLNGGSISHSSSDFLIGDLASSDGVVKISNGASVTAATTTLGDGVGSYGYFSVSGIGSTWTSNTYIYVGTVGTGQLDILSGGTVNAPNVSIGNNTGGSGGIVVDGAGSLLNVTNTLYVGSQGSGTVFIQNGASATTSTVSIGNNPGGDGFLRVTTLAPTLTNSGGILVGNASHGRMDMYTNAIVNTDTLTVGVNAGVLGEFATWYDSQVNMTGDLVVGLDGIGTFEEAGGADVTTPGKIRIGKQSGSTGTVKLHDYTSVMTTSDLRVGENGTGLFFLFDGATLAVNGGAGSVLLGSSGGGDGEFYIGYNGSSYGVGGTLNIASFDGGSGSAKLFLGTNSSAASPYYLTQTGLSGGADVAVTGSAQVITLSGYNVMSGTNSYSGGTVVNTGSVLVAGSNGALGVSGVQLDGGELRLAPGVTVNNPLSFGVSGGILSGNGTFGSGVTVGANEFISPGNSPGTLAFSSGLTLAGGSTLIFEIQSANGVAGTGYDLISVSGAVLDVAATSGSPVTIKLSSLDSGGNTGLVSDFSSSTNYAWTIATSSAGITNFAANKFTIDTSGFLNNLGTGGFYLTQSGNSLIVNFTPVPEPSTLALLAAGLGVFAISRRRRS